MNCINYADCMGQVDIADPNTYWEATVLIKDRDGGGPNRRDLKRTGRGLCPDCSLRVEYRLQVAEQEALF